MDDIGMIQTGARARFSIKALKNFLVISQLSLHQLDRDFPLQSGVEGSINNPHTTFCNGTQEVELPHHHGHHDGALTLGTRCRGKRLKITRDKHLGSTPTALHHFQGLAFFVLFSGHSF